MKSLKTTCCYNSVAISFIVTVCFVSVSGSYNSSCPTWFYYNNWTMQCECGHGLSCISDNKVIIWEGTCATSFGHGDQYYIGYCPFGHPVNRTNRMYSEMPSDPDMLDDVMCGPYNRKGLLCGECIDGYGPPVSSFDMKCVNCSKLSPGYATVLYLLIEVFPITVFFISLVAFRFNITSGPLLGYVIFCQFYVILLRENNRIYDFIQIEIPAIKFIFGISLSLSEFWNLNYFHSLLPPFCISEKLTPIRRILLDFVPATYPIVLVIMTCILMELHARNYRMVHILWKPFGIILNKTNITIGVTSDAVIHAFASFIFLSNATVYSINMGVVNYDILIRKYDGSIYRHALLYDPNIEWLSPQYILYSAIALVPLLLLTVIPSLLLIIYPTRIYSRCFSRCLSARKRLAITAFAEALHSCFKDGLNGTRDYRALAGLYPVIITLCSCNRKLLSYAGYSSNFPEVYSAILLCFIFTYIQPCKLAIANFSLGFLHVEIAIIYIVKYLWLNEPNSPTKLVLTFIIVSILPHILVFSWAGYKLTQLIVHKLSRCGHRFNLRHCCRVTLGDFVKGIFKTSNSYQELQ